MTEGSRVSAYATEIAVRWSDMDAFGHVNNASFVTLLEEARTELLFGAGAQAGAAGLARGVVVARLSVRYRRPLVYSGAPAALRLWVSELRAASFDLDYEVRDGRSGEVVATARTQLVPYDLAAARPLRITDLERAFLEGHRRTERSVPHA
jgi:acyl-CoA thioester hydrolase